MMIIQNRTNENQISFLNGCQTNYGRQTLPADLNCTQELYKTVGLPAATALTV